MPVWPRGPPNLQPPPSLEEAILVRECRLVEAQVGASTRPQVTLAFDRRAVCFLGSLVEVFWPLGDAGPLNRGVDYLKLGFGTRRRRRPESIVEVFHCAPGRHRE